MQSNGAGCVALTRAKGYSYETVRDAVRRQFELLGVQRNELEGKRIVIKPNLLMKRAPERFTTTHPMVVRCIVEQLLSLGVQAEGITLADSPGGPYTCAALEGIYRVSGMRQALEGTGVRLNMDVSHVRVRCGAYSQCAAFDLITPVAQADYVINVPKLKTHCMMTLSAGVKNLFGCVPGLMKPELHYRFPQEGRFAGMLVDLAQTVRPALTILDAIVSMEGDGPSSGTARETDLIAGARNPHALDAVVCRLAGLPDPATLRDARGRRLLTQAAPHTVGDTVEPFSPRLKAPRSKSSTFVDSLPGMLRRPVEKIAVSLAQPRPQVDTRRCVGCGKCAESCPAHTISLTDGKASIQHKRCIRCYCCQEMCPVQAIGVHRFGLFRL